jgi:hypothetical protein
MISEPLRRPPETIQLQQGTHETFEEGVCAMELVAWMAHEKHSDHPQCASLAIGEFVRILNDDFDDESRQMLSPYLGRIVGTRGTSDQEIERSWKALDWYCRVSLPAWLRSAGLIAEAGAVEATAPIVGRASALAAQDSLERAQARAEAARAAVEVAAGESAEAATAAAEATRAAGEVAARAVAGVAGGIAAVGVNRDAMGAARAATADAAWAAAMRGETLRPTVAALQRSALELLHRMIRVTETANAHSGSGEASRTQPAALLGDPS